MLKLEDIWNAYRKQGKSSRKGVCYRKSRRCGRYSWDRSRASPTPTRTGRGSESYGVTPGNSADPGLPQGRWAACGLLPTPSAPGVGDTHSAALKQAEAYHHGPTLLKLHPVGVIHSLSNVEWGWRGIMPHTGFCCCNHKPNGNFDNQLAHLIHQ